MIYVKTNMTEMPKGCRWVESGGNIEPCMCIEYCKANKIHILRNPFEPERAIRCPLIRKENIK